MLIASNIYLKAGVLTVFEGLPVFLFHTPNLIQWSPTVSNKHLQRVYFAFKSQAPDNRKINQSLILCCFSFSPFSFETETLKSLVVAADREKRVYFAFKSQITDNRKINWILILCCFSFSHFSFEAKTLKSQVVAAAPERGACWPALLKPITFLPGWRLAYLGGRREHICCHSALRLTVLESGWGSRFTLWQPLSPLPQKVYVALFSLIKQQNNPHVTSWKIQVGYR